MKVTKEDKKIARLWLKDEITHVEACRRFEVSLMGGYARLARTLKEMMKNYKNI